MFSDVRRASRRHTPRNPAHIGTGTRSRILLNSCCFRPSELRDDSEALVPPPRSNASRTWRGKTEEVRENPPREEEAACAVHAVARDEHAIRSGRPPHSIVGSFLTTYRGGPFLRCDLPARRPWRDRQAVRRQVSRGAEVNGRPHAVPAAGLWLCTTALPIGAVRPQSLPKQRTVSLYEISTRIDNCGKYVFFGKSCLIPPVSCGASSRAGRRYRRATRRGA